MTHHTWGLEDGLPDRVIHAIAQTPDGYLWLATPHGLVRFDGFKFVTFGTDKEPAIHEFGVSCILVAKDGTLWVGSVGGGLTHMAAGSTVHFGTEQGLAALTLRALYQSSDGTIWAGTDTGLFMLVGNQFRLVKDLHDESITTIVSDGANGFWVAGFNLTHFQDGRFTTITLPRRKSVIRSLALGRDGGLWIGATGTLLERRRDGRIEINRTVNADVRALCFDQADRLWIGTIGSGVLLRMPDGTITRELDPTEAASNAVRTIVSTRNGDLWIGTHAGLIRLSHTGMDFLKAANTGTADYGSVFLDRDDSVWLSTGNLNHYVNGQDRPISFPGVQGVHIRAVYREPSGAFWIGTVGNGAYRLVNGKITAHLLGSTAVTGFIAAPDGSLWLGTDGGVAEWAHGTLTRFQIYGDLRMSTVKAMALAPDGSLWIATPGGLFLFRNSQYVRPNVAQRLARYRVWSIYADSDGSLWIGAGTGLYLWRGGVLVHMSLPQFLSQSQAVISILVDSKGRFLIAEPAAIFRVSRIDLEHALETAQQRGPNDIREAHLLTEPEIFSVGTETGSELYSEIPGVGVTDRQGGTWYATSQGVVHVSAATLTRSLVAPPITIEKILVDGVPVSWNQTVVLPPLTRNIQIQATPILLSGITGLRLRRRLLGVDEKWSELVPGSSSSYSHLAPGRYTFKVEGYWPGMDSASSAEITILQQSAIYQRRSFLLFCVALTALLGWFLYWLKVHQIKLRFQAVADERSRVAREIHDTLLQGCIGALALLQALEISHEQSNEHLPSGQEGRWMTIVRCVRDQFGETIQEAREAIWNLRNADDGKSLDAVLRDTLERLTSRAEVATSFTSEGETVPINPRVQHEIIMSAREAILNSVSHAHADAIDVRLNFNSTDISVSICDDGVGFDVKTIPSLGSNHFGLCGMRDRMQKFRGSLVVDSHPGMGTKVRLALPLSACRVRMKE